MVQGYYTLEEAAEILNMEADKLSQMAQRREIRAFADRGTWRFRTQDVEELGRRLGIGSDPELQLGEAPASSKSSAKLPKPKKTSADELFDFELSSDSLDNEVADLDDPGAVRKKTTGAIGPKTTGKKATSAEEFFDFELGESTPDLDMSDDGPLRSPSVEDAPIGFQDSPGTDPASSGGRPRALKTSLPPTKGKTNLAGNKIKKTGVADGDSGVRLVPADDDGIPIPEDFVTGKVDSDVKLDPASLGDDAGVLELPLTEEVQIDDLDADLKKAADSGHGPRSSAKLSKVSDLDLSSSSPFELSEDDLDLGGDEGSTRKMQNKGPASSGRVKKTQAPPEDDDDEVSLGDLSLGDGDFSGASGASGINLHLPADTGINLERAAAADGSDEVEFELSLDGEGDDLVTGPTTAKNIGGSEPVASSADSEFELTLDESGGLAPLEEDAPSSDSTAEEKDIFETDFEIPALDEESGSEAVALDQADTDLESSDFEFDPDAQEEEEDSASQVVALDDEESGSQVQAIDEEDSDSGSVVVEEEDELGDMTDGQPEEEEEDEDLVPVGAASLPPAPWGALPTIFMLPCVAVMFVLGLMAFEMLHGMWGYRQPNRPATSMVLKPVTELFGITLPKE